MSTQSTDTSPADTGRALRWRVVDIVVASVLATAAGLVFVLCPQRDDAFQPGTGIGLRTGNRCGRIGNRRSAGPRGVFGSRRCSQTRSSFPF